MESKSIKRFIFIVRPQTWLNQDAKTNFFLCGGVVIRRWVLEWSWCDELYLVNRPHGELRFPVMNCFRVFCMWAVNNHCVSWFIWWTYLVVSAAFFSGAGDAEVTEGSETRNDLPFARLPWFRSARKVIFIPLIVLIEAFTVSFDTGQSSHFNYMTGYYQHF